MHGEKRLGDRLQGRMMLRKLHNPAREACLRGSAHFETKASQDASEAHLYIVELSLRELACGQKRARLLRRRGFAMHRLGPTEPAQLRDAACIVSIRLHRHRLEGVAHMPRL